MDHTTSESRSSNMRQIRSKGMKPEITVRSLVHKMGYRFRLHRNDLPGKPDLVFPGQHKIIFVHGCFWHKHTNPQCRLAHAPRSNGSYWEPKLARNASRDIQAQILLKELGWNVLIIWECELKEIKAVKNRIGSFLARKSYR